MDSGRWIPADGFRQMDSGRWIPADGFRQMDSGRWSNLPFQHRVPDQT
jgi:hypothetical protein